MIESELDQTPGKKKPRKPRNFTARNYDEDSFKLYVDLVVTAFCELLGIERGELAFEERMGKTYLSSVLRHGVLTDEMVKSLDGAMNRLLKKTT